MTHWSITHARALLPQLLDAPPHEVERILARALREVCSVPVTTRPRRGAARYFPFAVGERHGVLVAVESVSVERGRRMVRWACDCGGSITTELRNVRYQRTRSCGCLRRKGVAA